MIDETDSIFKHFFDISPDLMCIAGFDGYFKKINASVCKLLGYTEAELLSKPISNFIYTDDQTLTATVRGELTRNSPLHNFENRYLTKKGEIVWLTWTSMPDVNEKLIYAIAKNVTHKKILEAERNSLLIDFTRMNSELKQLCYTHTHDLRSPVNNLLSIFSLVDLSKISDTDTLQFIKMLETTSENLKEALNKYLDILIQRENSNVKIETVFLNESLTTVLLSINALIEDSNVAVVTDFSVFEEIQFNRPYMDSIFLNLITNSIKYAQPDIRPKIVITTRIKDGVQQLVFKDNGIGFDMEAVKEKIFGLNQKFHDHEDSRGIGLYLVHNHVHSLGGQISVESEVNRGTKFIIAFKK